MPRSEAERLGKNEPNSIPTDGLIATEARVHSRRLHRVERAFRWIADFRNEPNFIITPVKISA